MATSTEQTPLGATSFPDYGEKRRSSVERRGSQTRKSVKNWMETCPEADGTFVDKDADAGMKIVLMTTRFATGMCVIIACVKVCVYLWCKAAVVKTSALDSLGDLVANIVTVYTGYRMTQIDVAQFPIGQAKFEAIGILVFSTLMAATMLGNALNNIEDLTSEAELATEDALDKFFGAMFGQHKELEGNHHVWTHIHAGYSQVHSVLGDNISSLPEFFQTAFSSGNFTAAKEAIGLTVERVAEIPDPELKWSTLRTTNIFLACCASYKFCLWMFCVLYAIPKSNSNVLRALAADKRNDFFCTSSVIAVTFLAYFKKDEIDEVWDSDKVDPLLSLILSAVIMSTWISMMFDQIKVLSASSADPEAMAQIRSAVLEYSDPSGTCLPDNVIAYHSSSKFTVEIDLSVVNAQTPFGDITQSISGLKEKVECVEDVERVIITPKTRREKV